MRPLNFGLFAVIGGIVGLQSCADDPEPPEIIPGPNMPFPTGGSNTGGIRATGGASTNAGGSKNSSSGSGGRSSTGSSKCPTEQPDYGDACTPPTDGTTLKCVYEVTTTCTCRRSVSTGKMIWDCAANTGTGGKASTGGRAAFAPQGGATGQGGNVGGGTAKAGGFGF